VDARKLKLLPGVSEVKGAVKNTFVENWSLQKALEAALFYRTLPTDSNEDWLELVLDRHKETTSVASKRGDVLHACLERTIKEGVLYGEEFEFIEPVIAKLDKELPGQTWVTERAFACRDGYGGRIDLSSDRVVLDFKCKDTKNITNNTAFAEFIKKNLYDDYVMQLAAYRRGLGIKADCYNLFVSVPLLL
jgi:hypothetical protein